MGVECTFSGVDTAAVSIQPPTPEHTTMATTSDTLPTAPLADLLTEYTSTVTELFAAVDQDAAEDLNEVANQLLGYIEQRVEAAGWQITNDPGASPSDSISGWEIHTSTDGHLTELVWFDALRAELVAGSCAAAEIDARRSAAA